MGLVSNRHLLFLKDLEPEILFSIRLQPDARIALALDLLPPMVKICAVVVRLLLLVARGLNASAMSLAKLPAAQLQQ